MSIALYALTACYFVMNTATMSIIGLVLPIAADLGTTPSAIANLVTIFSLTYAVGAPVAQLVLGRLPRRRLIQGGLVTMAVAGGLGAAASTYETLLLSRILMGAGASLVGPMLIVEAVSLVPLARQTRALSIVMLGVTLSNIFGMPTSAWAGDAFGWRAVIGGLGALSLLQAGLLALLPPGPPSAPPTPARAAIGLVLGSRPAQLAILACVGQMCALFTTFALVAPLLAERFGIVGQRQVALMLMLYGIGALAANLVSGRWGDRIGVGRVIVVSLVGMIVTFVAMATIQSSNVTVVGVLFLMLGLTGLLFYPPQQSLIANILPPARNLMMSLYGAALYVGMSLGTFSGAAVMDRFGPGLLPAVSALATALALVAAIGSLRPTRKEPATADA